jgi:hypothetical protein
MANTKSIGDTSEAVVLAEFIKAGFPVLLPFGDNQRYDMVVEAYGRLLRVQCKTARPVHSGAVLCFNASSGAFGPGDRSPNRRRSYRSEADLFAAYAPCTGQVYVLAVDEVPETEVWLRLTPTENHQQRRIRWAEDHTLAAWAGAAVNASTSADHGPSGPRAGGSLVRTPVAPTSQSGLDGGGDAAVDGDDGAGDVGARA